MQIVDPDIEYYAEQHTLEETELLREITETTVEELEYSEMLTGRVVGQLLYLLVKMTGAKRILEVGTFTGYSALNMAAALPGDGELITCEINERYEEMARSYFERSRYGDKIQMIMGDALETIEQLDSTFDFCFLDADKASYPEYYDLILPRLKSGGVLVVDNVFWSGEVLEPKNEQSTAIDRLNKRISEDERVEQVLLTVRDGLTLLRKV
ncbi:MAG: class I SAM-dependent methyltransferase [Balneolaceae bacterium]|nr:class I SAM-dependent methyltransferase [Balneolaceae bacterium]